MAVSLILDPGTEACPSGHDLTSAAGLTFDDGTITCRKCEGLANRSYKTEWTNHRGQVFVFLPDHPYSRKDGFYPRAKLAMELHLGRFLDPEEKVYHVDETADNDDPENLIVFPNMHALQQHRTKIYHEKKQRAISETGDKWGALTPAQREHMENLKRERDLERELKAREEAEQRSRAALQRANQARAEKAKAKKAQTSGSIAADLAALEEAEAKKAAPKPKTVKRKFM